LKILNGDVLVITSWGERLFQIHRGWVGEQLKKNYHTISAFFPHYIGII